MMHRGWAGAAALLLAGLWGVAPAGHAQDPVLGEPGDHYNTVDLIQRTVRGLPQCIQYCLLGFEIRIRYTGYTVEVYLVPRVEHYLAALHVMTADRFPQEAYTEWAESVGEIQKRLLDALARTLPPLFGGQPLVESSGGQTRQQEYGFHQATQFKEAEIIGHPVAYLSVLLDQNGHLNPPGGGGTDGGSGSSSSGTDGNSGGGNSRSNGALSFIDPWQQWAARCFSDPNQCAGPPEFPVQLIFDRFKIQDYAATLIDAIKVVGFDFPKIAQQLREIGDALADHQGIGGGLKIDRLLCRNDVVYFYPYYLSGLDALFWRSGAPITDVRHLDTLVNPFSQDRIGRAPEIWSHIYPRHGFVNNDHPGRVAPVLAYRSAHLVGDATVTLRPKRTTDYAHGHWQNLAPQPTLYCAANIADLPTPIDPEGGYGHNIWPRFECPLSDIGTRVGFIPYRHCFTPSFSHE